MRRAVGELYIPRQKANQQYFNYGPEFILGNCYSSWFLAYEDLNRMCWWERSEERRTKPAMETLQAQLRKNGFGPELGGDNPWEDTLRVMRMRAHDDRLCHGGF